MSVSAGHPAQVEDTPSARERHRPGAVGRLSDGATVAVLVVALATVVGAVIRLIVARQPLFADELSSYWIVSGRGLGDVVATVHTDAEITPPLFFLLSWLSSQLGNGPELLRLPSLIAGIATVPLVYLLGLRTVGRGAAAVAAVLTALSPFMIYYSAEARGYGLMMALVVGSTLAMLLALDTGRARWWVVYAVCSLGAMYTHYTCAFVLAAQLVWVLWAHPDARRPAVLANLGALVGFLPWTTGALNDFRSPTGEILSALSPFTVTAVRSVLEHWAVGYPYSSVARLSDLPGWPALAMFGAAILLALVGLVARRPRVSRVGHWSRDRRIVLVVALLASVPVGEAVVSVFSTHLFGVRNLAASWPALALGLAALLVAAGPRLRVLTVGLAVISFAVGAGKMLTDRFSRPDYQAAADFVDRTAAARDVVVDETATLSPGPFSNLDVEFDRRHRTFRANAPQENERPFSVLDPIVPRAQATRQAVAAARGGRIFIVTDPRRALLPGPPAPYRLIVTRTYAGFIPTTVQVYGAFASPRG